MTEDSLFQTCLTQMLLQHNLLSLYNLNYQKYGIKSSQVVAKLLLSSLILQWHYSQIYEINKEQAINQCIQKLQQAIFAKAGEITNSLQVLNLIKSRVIFVLQNMRKLLLDSADDLTQIRQQINHFNQYFDHKSRKTLKLVKESDKQMMIKIISQPPNLFRFFDPDEDANVDQQVEDFFK